MAVNTVLGNTVITQWRLALQFNPPLITSKVLREKFDFAYKQTTRIVYKDIPMPEDPSDMPNATISAMHQLPYEGSGSIAQPMTKKSCG